VDSSPRNDNPAPIVERPPQTARNPQPTENQLSWMRRGLAQPGGKLPLFDDNGQKISERTVRSCLEHGWVEPWFANPVKPDWIICKLTEAGRRLFADS
jgi:hypothetical protein